MKQLVRLREKTEAIKAAGGDLVAVSVDRPEDSKALLARLKQEGTPLEFPLLCDPSRAAVRAMGVYDAAHDIALPSTMILDRGGKIAWKYVAESIMDRPAEDELISALKRLVSATPGPKGK